LAPHADASDQGRGARRQAQIATLQSWRGESMVGVPAGRQRV